MTKLADLDQTTAAKAPSSSTRGKAIELYQPLVARRVAPGPGFGAARMASLLDSPRTASLPGRSQPHVRTNAMAPHRNYQHMSSNVSPVTKSLSQTSSMVL